MNRLMRAATCACVIGVIGLVGTSGGRAKTSARETPIDHQEPPAPTASPAAAPSPASGPTAAPSAPSTPRESPPPEVTDSIFEPTVSLVALTGLRNPDHVRALTIGVTIFPSSKGLNAGTLRHVHFGLHIEQVALEAKSLDPDKTSSALGDFAVGIAAALRGFVYVSFDLIVHPNVRNRGHFSFGVTPEILGKIKSIFTHDGDKQKPGDKTATNNARR